jgi:glycerate kinase
VTPPIATRVLLAACAFSARLSAERVADAIARGLRSEGADDSELVLLEKMGAERASAQLERVRFDERMRAARAVVIAVPSLDPRTLARGAAFEIATRARQGGVPAYAVARESRLSSFDARVLDLQLVLIARAPRALEAAGRRLAGVL